MKEDISVFDIFKIGIGPSSSHTMGPWKAALDFAESLKTENKISKVVKIQIELFGSLAKTGKGHGTDMGVMMGLLGEIPEEIDPDKIPALISKIHKEKKIHLLQEKEISFYPSKDIIYTFDEQKGILSKEKLSHPNTLIISCQIKNKNKIEEYKIKYVSIGGGFIEKGKQKNKSNKNFIYSINSAQDLIDNCKKNNFSIVDLIKKNELCHKTKEELNIFLDKIIRTMLESVYHGCHTEGIIPGGLNVHRRAKEIYQSLTEKSKDKPTYEKKPTKKTIDEWVNFINKESKNFTNTSNWVACFALAVNEENACYRKIVTSPTNGSAGVIPAILLYSICLDNTPNRLSIQQQRDFLFCAGEIASLFKKGSTISAAAGGCQAEIGVSSAMAAAALTMLKGGNIYQIMTASEIAMEHHLGLTCDPIKGLVQIPCIERNTMGAMKAIMASNLAFYTDYKKTVVHLDEIIKTMWQTAKDMNSKYKETAEGGLAQHVSVKFSEC